MPGHLERRATPPAGVAHHADAQVDPGASTSMSQLVFNKKALIYERDMPRTFRQGVRASTELALRSGQARVAGELILAADAPTVIAPRDPSTTRRVEEAVIASGMRQLDKPRKASGRIVQRRIGWQATPESVIITTAERELAKTDQGKLAPSGPWLIEERRTYPAAGGKATKRTGDVPMGDSRDSSTQGESRSALGTEAAAAQAFPEGAATLGVLPASVRSSAIARVPSPSQFDGVILQEPDAQGNPVRLEVNVLRMDNQRAVVIQASRGMSETTWAVSQAAYSLGDAEIEQA